MSFPNATVPLLKSTSIPSVSILVLVDVLPEPCRAYRAASIFFVSILVLVDVLPEPRQPAKRYRKVEVVSILVLVDVLPELFFKECERYSGSCFNPCFSGCPSRTPLDPFLEEIDFWFQSLF